MMQIVYVSSPESQQIYVWKLDDSKLKLELIQVVNTLGNVQPITIHPNQKFLYAGIRPDFGIITYSINAQGLLKEIKITKIFSSPTFLCTNKTGNYLYCASYQKNTIDVLSISKLGILKHIIQTVKNLMGCHSVNMDNNNKLLWAPCLLESNIRIFNIDKLQGLLTAHNPDQIFTHSANIQSSPRHMVFHSDNSHAYVINELNGTIDVIKYNFKQIKNSIISLQQTIKIIPTNNIQKFWSSDIHITPNSRWVYCTDRLHDTISYFQILPIDKKLKFINLQKTEKQPRGFSIDATGQFLIVAGQKSNHIALYSIDNKNGQLNLIERYVSGLGPMWINIISIKKVQNEQN